MNDIQIFPSKEFGEIRTIMINGIEYFFGVDIATALQYKRPRWAVTTHCKGVMTHDSLKNGGNYPEPLIPIGDIYRLIVKASSQSNNEEIKAKAERFERLVFDEILTQIHKTGNYGAPKTTLEQIQLLAQGNVEVNQRVAILTERVDKIELDLPILPLEAYEIEKSVRKKGVEILGGKKSSAYNDRGLRQKLYNDLYANLKHNFDVRTYKAIRRKDADKAVQIVNEYKPPLFLADQIENANAQQRIDV